MNHIQNNQKSTENPYQPMDFKKAQEKNPGTKSFETCQMFVICKRKLHPRVWI